MGLALFPRSLRPWRTGVRSLLTRKPAIELFMTGFVQTTMRGIKIMLASLLPLLWLAASGQGSAHAPFNSTVVGCRTSVSISSAGHDQGGPKEDACSPGKSARHLGRRAGPHSSLDRTSTPVVISNSRLSGLRQVWTSANGAEASSGLATCWQFYWRTASEPRAPSPGS